jgi:hypothetical protein
MQVLESSFGVDGVVEQCKAKDAVHHDGDYDSGGDPVDSPVLFHFFLHRTNGVCFL